MLYLVALFLHITGALLLAAATGMEWLCVDSLQKDVTLENVRQSVASYSRLSMVGGIAMALILIPGIYMMAVEWMHYAGWIMVSFCGIILMGIIGGTTTGRRIRGIGKSLVDERALSPELKKRITENSFQSSIRIRTLIFLGIVLVMIAKPAAVTSVLILAASIVVGSLAWFNTKRTSVAAQAEPK